jgi:hypothetical protein
MNQEPQSTAADRGAQEMHMPNPTPRALLAQLLGQQSPSAPPSSIVWLTVTLVADTGTAEYDRFRKRLQAFLAGSGLLAAVAFDRIALIAHQGSGQPVAADQETLGGHPARSVVTSTDKALVMDWLMHQPEVVLIAVSRPRPVRGLTQQRNGRNGHGQGSN